MAQQHSIQSIQFDLDFLHKDKAHELQNRISRLFSNSLTSLLDQFFSDNTAPGMVYKADRVVLDLGKVDYSRLEQEITEKLPAALAARFSKLYGRRGFDDQPGWELSQVPVEAELLQVFRDFLRAGFFSWTVAVPSLALLQEELDPLFSSEPASLQAVIMKEGRYDYVRRRLAYQFRSPFLHRVIHLLEREEAPFIIHYHAQVQQVHHAEPVVQTDEVSFGKEVWFFILTYLVAEKGNIFSRKEFIKSAFRQMAARFRADYATILSVFSRAVQALALPGGKTELTELISQISEEEYQHQPASQTNKTSTSRVDQSDAEGIRLFRYYLENGSLPPGANLEDAQTWYGLFTDLVNRRPEPVRKILQGFTAANIVLRIRHVAGDKGIEEIVRLFRPSSVRAFMELAGVLQTALSRSLQVLVPPMKREVQELLIGYVRENRTGGLAGFMQHAAAHLSRTPGVQSADFRKQIVTALRSRSENGWMQELANRLETSEDIGKLDQQPADRLQVPVHPAKYGKQDAHLADDESLPVLHLFDLLVYFIDTGTLPWWTAEEGIPLKSRLETLLQLSPLQAVEVLQMAGRKQEHTNRVLYQFPPSLILDIIRHLPLGETAWDAFAVVASAVARTGPEYAGKFERLELLLIRKIWTNYRVHHYQYFDQSWFMIQAVKEIMNGYGLSVSKYQEPMVALIMQNDPSGWGQALGGLLAGAPTGIPAVSNLLSPAWTAPGIFTGNAGNNLPEHYRGTLSTGQLQEVIDLMAGKENEPPVSEQNFFRYTMVLTGIIEHVLVHGELPTPIRQRAGSAQAEYLKTILLILYKADPGAVTALLEKYAQQPGKQVLAALFPVEESREKELYLLVNKAPSTRFLSTPGPAPAPAAGNSFPDTGVVLPLVQQFYAPPENKRLAVLKEEAVRVLEYFLTWNTLPPARTGGTGLQTGEVLIEIMLFLYEFDSKHIEMLLADHRFLSEAKLRLAALFSPHHPAGTEAAVFSLLLAAAQAVLPEYLLEQDVHQTTGSHGEGAVTANVPIGIPPNELHESNQVAGLLSANEKDGQAGQSHSTGNNAPPNSPSIITASPAMPASNEEGTLLVSFLSSTVQQSWLTADDVSSLTLDATPAGVLGSLLDYFLTQGKLPGKDAFSPAKQSRLVRKIALLLFSKDRALLRNLLGKEDHNVQARIQLQDWLHTLPPAPSGDLAALMDTFLQRDVLRYIGAGNSLSSSESKETAGLLFKRIIHQAPAAERQAFIRSLTAYRSVTLYAVQQLARGDWHTLLEKAGSGQAKEYLPLAAELQTLLYPLLSSRNDQTLFDHLQKEFSLLVVSGNIAVYSRTEYLSRFFAFLDARQPVFLPGIYSYLQQRIPGGSLLQDASLQKQLHIEVARRIATTPDASGDPEDGFNDLNQLYARLEKTDSRWLRQYKPVISFLEKLYRAAGTSHREQLTLLDMISSFSGLVLSEKINVKDHAGYLAAFFDYFDEQQPGFSFELLKKMQQVHATNTFFPDPALKKQFLEEMGKRKAASSQPAPQQPNGLLMQSPGKWIQPDKKQLRPERNEQAMLPETAQREPIIEEGTKLYVNNAGLVLMHPFIPTFFMLIGLVKQGKFVDELARQRAVLLLQHLVYGTDEFEEHELVLNKILCGLPLEEPVPQKIILTEKETGTAAELFKIIFQRWDKAKNSSVEGFRNSFLKRAGSLLYLEEGWQLKVEQKGYDLILQTLPWTFGMVKFPWMEKAVFTEWI